MKNFPNYISGSRIVLSVSLLFVMPFSALFYCIYLLCGISDMLDGFVARRWKASSVLGERLDSLSDFIMAVVLFIILIPRVHITKELMIWMIMIALFRVLSVVISCLRFKRPSMLHTYGNKITGFVIFLFPFFYPFLRMNIWIIICCGIASISAAEEVLIQLTSKELDANRKSIFTK